MAETIDQPERPRGLYPQGTQAGLLDTPLVTAPTRTALVARRDAASSDAPAFLSGAAFATLRAVCAMLLAQDSADAPVDVAGQIDAALAQGKTDGWRYDSLPPDGEAMRSGLAAIDETAQALAGRGFVACDAAERAAVLGAIQRGDPPGAVWQTLDARRFFEEVLAAATQRFYASAFAQDEIGYVGYADAHGWHAIGLDQRDGPEPEPVP